MKIVYTPAHREHSPKWYVADGATRPGPETPERAERILDALRQAGGHVVVEPAADPMPAVRATHEAEYLRYLENIHAVWAENFGDVDVLPDTFLPPRRPTPLRRPAWPVAQAGYYCFDMAAPLGRHTYRAALEAAAGAVTAADLVLAGEPAAYALVRPPGHHAGRDYCGGFCYLNNVAIAAHHILLARPGAKVAILDVDYHHGNGTQDIFYEHPDVLFVSIHADPNTQYPYFWGHADERGSGPGEGLTFNLPLPRGSSAATWFSALDIALTRVAAFAPAVLLVSLGVDTYEKDAVGDFQLAVADFKRLGRALRAANLPTLIVQEGGYTLEAVGLCVAEVLSGFES